MTDATAGSLDSETRPLLPDADHHLVHRRARHHHRRRWRIVLLVAVGVLVVYYGLVIGSLQLRNAGAVALDDGALSPGPDRVNLEVEALALDPGTGTFDMQLRPVPRGALAGERPGQLALPLELQVVSVGQPPMTFDFPSGQIIDPVGVSVDTVGGAQSFPFDKPRADFHVVALSADVPVPVAVEMVDQTEGWNLRGTVAPDDDGVRFDLGARREMLPVSFTLFYIAGIVVVALITVALIGGAIVRGEVGFDQVIWLGAMLVAVPAVRNEMPGVPAIGTAVDMFIFLPAVVIVAAALLASIVVLTLHEAAQHRTPAGDEDG